MRRSILLFGCLAWLALTSDVQRVRFIQPKATIVLSGPYGVDVPVQTYVPRDARNRVWALAWDGEACGGSSMHTLYGAEDSAVHPIEPLNVRVGVGACRFVVAVHRSDRTRETAELTLDVR